MSDSVMSQLSAQGYQPVFIPVTSLVPPEVYVYVPKRRILERWGALKDYAPKVAEITPQTQIGPNLGNTSTRALDAKGMLNLLERVMKWLGLAGKVTGSFHFAGNTRFRYEFKNITASVVTRSQLQPLIRNITFHGSLDSLIDPGYVHVALEYLYAKEITLRQAEGKAFDASAKAEIKKLFGAEASAKLKLDDTGYVIYDGKGRPPGAFAYKAMQLFHYDGKIEIGGQAIKLAPSEEVKESFYTPAEGEFLDVEEPKAR
jgi:hypothetical protein